MLVQALLVSHAQRLAGLGPRRGLDALGVLLDADRALLDGRARERDEGGAVVEGDEHPLGGACRLVEEDLVDRAQAVAAGREHVTARPVSEVMEVALRREIGHGP